MTGKIIILQKEHEHASLQTSASLIDNTARVVSVDDRKEGRARGLVLRDPVSQRNDTSFLYSFQSL